MSTAHLPWLAGRLSPPGDKSLGHRLLLLAALRPGPTVLSGLPAGEDLRATARLVRSLGAEVEETPGCVTIDGPGLEGLHPPADPIDCANSGTTARLGLGLLAGLGFAAVLDGDSSLRGRPMERVCAPLRLMGARITTTRGGLPAVLEGGALHGIEYTLPVASAQLKSALLLAGLFAGGETRITEPLPSRDHTERLLGLLPCAPGSEPQSAPGPRTHTVDRTVLPRALAGLPRQITVPGDPSSAAFFLAAALGLPGSLLEVRGLLLNPGRCAYLQLLESRGARLRWQQTGTMAGEPVGDLIASATPGLGLGYITAERLPSLLDEIPALAALSLLTGQALEVQGARELRLKESDRIAEIHRVCAAFGARVSEWDDGFRLEPGRLLAPPELHTGPDHRIAMMASVIALAAPGPCRLVGTECIAVSYPGFPFVLQNLVRHGARPWDAPSSQQSAHEPPKGGTIEPPQGGTP